MRSARVVCALSAVTALMAVGCGSTVQGATAQQVAPAAGGLAAPANNGAAGSAAPSLRGVPAAPNAVAGAAGSANASQTGAALAPGRSSDGAATTRTGGTPVNSSATPLKVGMMYSSDENTVLAQVGSTLREPNFEDVQNAVVAYINKTGGIAGHRLVATYYHYSTTDSSQSISQGACTQWTQDDHVFAAMPSDSAEDQAVMRQCLTDANTLGVYANSYAETTEAQFRQAPAWFELDTLSLERWAQVYVSGLEKQGFFHGAKIGVVYDSYPQFTQVTSSVLLPALHAAGANVVATFAQNAHYAGDVGSGSQQMSSAVLRFRSKGVTKVLFFDAWVVPWVLFAKAADSQKWNPIYGLSSQDSPQDSIESGVLPADQLRGARLVDWNASFDFHPGDGGTWTRQLLCKRILHNAAINIESYGTDGYAKSLSDCGGLLALQDAGAIAAQPLTTASLSAAIEQLGTKLQSPDVPAVRFAAGRHNGAAGWRPASYQSSCTCFKPTGPVNRF